MLLFAENGNVLQIIVIAATFIILIVAVIVFAILGKYLRLWIQSVSSSAGIGIFDLLGMTFRKIDPRVIVRSKIMAVQSGLGEETGITTKALEAHYMAGGKVPLVVRAIIAANKAKMIILDYKLATSIDLAGRDVLEAVQTSVYPKVIDCPARGSGKDSLEAVAKNGVQLKVKARVTVRANLSQLVGGATEQTIIARVGQGIVSAIGSAERHADVLANPDRISKAVLAGRLDSQTAFEIVSIDIADIDVGDNIGARLQADQAEAEHAGRASEGGGTPGQRHRPRARNGRPDRRKPGEARRCRGRSPQGDLSGHPQRHAGDHGLLQAAKRPSRHRHAPQHRRQHRPADGASKSGVVTFIVAAASSRRSRSLALPGNALSDRLRVVFGAQLMGVN